MLIFYYIYKNISQKRKSPYDLCNKKFSRFSFNFLTSKNNLLARFILIIGNATVRLMPSSYLKKVKKNISLISTTYTGLNFQSVLGFKSITAISFSLLAAIVLKDFPKSFFVFPLSFILSFFIPDFFINIFINKLKQKNDKELAYVADLIYVATLSGQSIYNSIKIVTEEYKSRISDEFMTFLKDLELGFGKEESYRRLLKRDNSESFKRFVFMLQQAENYGSSISDIIKQKADFSRFEISQNIDKQTRMLSTKMLFPLIFLVLPAFMLIVGGPLIYVIGGDFIFN
jgi:tight adherence protein C